MSWGFLEMMQPRKPKAASNDKTSPAFPEATFGFMHGISAIGTKFQDADQMGPQSQKNTTLNNSSTRNTLRFDFYHAGTKYPAVAARKR